MALTWISLIFIQDTQEKFCYLILSQEIICKIAPISPIYVGFKTKSCIYETYM